MNRWAVVVWVMISMAFSGCTGKAEQSQAAPQTSGRLEQATTERLLTYMRRALTDSASTQVGNTEAVAAPVEAGAVSDAAAQTFSTTNLQEAGVDEADLLKLDGQRGIVYSIDSGEQGGGVMPLPELPASTPVSASERSSEAIRILQLAANGQGVSELARIQRPDDGTALRGLYLLDLPQQLVSVATTGASVWGHWYNPGYFSAQKTRVDLFDVQQPAQPELKASYTFEGSLVASRRVDTRLYLVLRTYPSVSELIPNPATQVQITQNAQRLAALTERDVLPGYSLNGASKGPLVQAGQCYLNQAEATPGADVITLVSMDLRSPTPQLHSRCYVGTSEALYASQQALYLASTRSHYAWTGNTAHYSSSVTTDIHKFAFDGASLSYRGSAEIEGHLGWEQDRKSFRFNESAGGDLRVLTFVEPQTWAVASSTASGVAVDGAGSVEAPVSDAQHPIDTLTPTVSTSPGTTDESPVRLSILREAPDRTALELIAQLPNATRPTPIGKPGERLYASRYIGDRAYLITFRVTDPLYVLDLSNPHDPLVAGELEMSGYADYLHPVSEQLLLGIGKEAIPAAADGWGDGRGAWYQGLKLALIDIADPQHPKEVDRRVIGKRGTSSAALYAHHAMTTLRVNEVLRVALPVALHDTPSPYATGAPWDGFDYTHTGLYRYEIDTQARKILNLPPLIVASRDAGSEAEYWQIGTEVYDRSLIVDDWVYFLHAGRFWTQRWDGAMPAIGPE